MDTKFSEWNWIWIWYQFSEWNWIWNWNQMLLKKHYMINEILNKQIWKIKIFAGRFAPRSPVKSRKVSLANVTSICQRPYVIQMALNTRLTLCDPRLPSPLRQCIYRGRQNRTYPMSIFTKIPRKPHIPPQNRLKTAHTPPWGMCIWWISIGYVNIPRILLHSVAKPTASGALVEVVILIRFA